jgi:Tol biopolymer transport system component
MSEFDISADGQSVAFAALDAKGNSHVWVAPLDRHAPPRQLTASVARQPGFRPGGDVYFLVHEGSQDFLYGIGPKETVPRTFSGTDGISTNEYLVRTGCEVDPCPLSPSCPPGHLYPGER